MLFSCKENIENLVTTSLKSAYLFVATLLKQSTITWQQLVHTHIIIGQKFILQCTVEYPKILSKETVRCYFEFLQTLVAWCDFVIAAIAESNGKVGKQKDLVKEGWLFYA